MVQAGEERDFRACPNVVRFRDDGIIPNHPRWPLILYRGAVCLPGALDPAAVFEDLFESNGWGNSWRNGIYDYVHYHSRIHEVLGVARGRGKVQFGGNRGRAVDLQGRQRRDPARRNRAQGTCGQQRFSGDRRLSTINRISFSGFMKSRRRASPERYHWQPLHRRCVQRLFYVI